MNQKELVYATNDHYNFGFKDDIEPLFSTGIGLDETTVRTISAKKHEPTWMLEYRLSGFKTFQELSMPAFGPDLSTLKLEQLIYFQRMTEHSVRSWDDVPETVKVTFDKIGVPEAERKYLAGVSAQYESEVIYQNIKAEFKNKGIIFTDMDTAVREYPQLVQEYFGTVIHVDNNKFAALNFAVWSGGTFIYVPKNIKIDIPIQTFFRINAANTGQFERTLIIVDEGASINYIEGCTAPMYSADSLHAAVVEVIVKKNGFCRYTTLQNWSNNVYSLETKRAIAYENSTMEWIDGNLGSKVTMKYPSVILAERFARASMLSIAFANGDVFQDTGAKMIHLAPDTSSTIISKSLCKRRGVCNYRGTIKIDKHSINAKSHVECDTIILDDTASSDTIPTNIVENGQVTLEHEAKVSKISQSKLYYLMSRGLSVTTATKMIIMGFIEPFTQQLPMEYAVELNRLIEYQMEDSVG